MQTLSSASAHWAQFSGQLIHEVPFNTAPGAQTSHTYTFSDVSVHDEHN